MDSSKVNRPALVQVCPVSHLDAVVMDDGVTEQDRDALEHAGATVVVVHPRQIDEELRLEVV
jgi:DeoR/GlpR family transcriptional regulator of sugar metabolism